MHDTIHTIFRNLLLSSSSEEEDSSIFRVQTVIISILRQIFYVFRPTEIAGIKNLTM
jgi:hypothetical protein